MTDDARIIPFPLPARQSVPYMCPSVCPNKDGTMDRKDANRARITKQAVAALVAPDSGEAWLWDTEVRNFGVRRSGRTGRAVYLIRYRNRHGRQRKHTIGRVEDWTPQKARARAQELFRLIAAGADPAARREADKVAPTVADLEARYMREHAEARKAPRSVSEDRKLWRSVILPRWRTLHVPEVSREHVERLMADLAATPFLANRARSLISKAMNLAEVWGWRPQDTNPCRHVERLPEGRRYYFLSPDELVSLGKALRWADAESDGLARVAALVRLLLTSGRRPDEWISAKRRDVDLGRGELRVGRDKGTKRARVHYLSPEARAEVERAVERFQPEPDDLLLGVWSYAKRWRQIRDMAGLPETVRIYDCRHTYGSIVSELGGSQRAVGALLGHEQLSTTEIYTHVRELQTQQYADRVSSTIAILMGGEEAKRGNEAENRRNGNPSKGSTDPA